MAQNSDAAREPDPVFSERLKPAVCPPEPVDDPEIATDFFRAIGKQIGLLRERAGLSRKELGARIGYGEDLIASVELGRRTPRPELLEAADKVLGAEGLLSAAKDDVLKAKARARVRHPLWFRDYARLEAEAVQLDIFSTLTVPGLLQTEDYARTVFSVYQPLLDEETVENRVTARLARQEILNRWPPPMVSAVIEEPVLLRHTGGRDVQRKQLEHLLQIGQLRHITLQVLPITCEAHAGLEGPFILLTPKGRHQVAYAEVQDVSRLTTDLEEVRRLAARYGGIRGQALNPGESATLIEKRLEEL